MRKAKTRAEAAVCEALARLQGPAQHWMSTSSAGAVLGVSRRSVDALVTRRVLEARSVTFDPAVHVDGRYDRREISVRSIDLYRQHAKPRPWQSSPRGQDLRTIHPRLTLNTLADLDDFCGRHTLPRDRALELAVRQMLDAEHLDSL